MNNASNHPVVLILGAGFSKCAGLPLQSEFSPLLLSSDFATEIDVAITNALTTFLKDVFGWCAGSRLPDLEDIFTCIDLAAGSGHHLGIQYTPKKLRAIRRMAIHRIFSVLDLHFSHSDDIDTLLGRIWRVPSSRPAFVVLNWDIVLEKHLMRMHPQPKVTYCCRSYDWHSPQTDNETQPASNLVPICKMHGSGNWVYCDNCDALFYDLNEKLPLKALVDLIKADFRLFDESFTDQVFDRAFDIASEGRRCAHCNYTVSSHIATFSYRKSFRTHAYASIWNRAAEILAAADRWIFIGYSLPKPDFELKHLLKTAQLRFAHQRKGGRKLQIDVVAKTNASESSYEGLFGKGTFRFFDGGLVEYLHRGLA